MRSGLLALGAFVAAAAMPSIAAAQGGAADSATAARRARMLAGMEAARARAESAAARVIRIVARPTALEVAVGDSVFSQDLWGRIEVLGITAAGDTVRGFAKAFALQPNPYLEQRGSDLLARQAGTAMLWIYPSSRPSGPFFSDTSRVARVEIHVK